MRTYATDEPITSPIEVKFENSRDFIERLLAMPNHYPERKRDNYLRQVRGTGANLFCENGKWAESISL